MMNKKVTTPETGKFKLFLSRIIDWLSKHYIFKIIVLFLPSLFGPIVVTGKLFGLANDKGYTPLGWIVLVFVFMLNLIILILISIKENRDLKKEEYWKSIIDPLRAEIKLLNTITESDNQIEKERLDKLLIYLNRLKNQPIHIYDVLNDSLSPTAHLISISDEIKQCFESLIDIKKRDICITMAISIDNENWEWISQADTSDCTPIDQISNEGSTFYQVSSGKQSYIYFNDKSLAQEQNMYVMSRKDNNHSIKGSIICWGLSALNNRSMCVKMILSISTYGKQLTSLTDTKGLEQFYVKRIKDVILAQFENEIKLDLALFYMLSQLRPVEVRSISA